MASHWAAHRHEVWPIPSSHPPALAGATPLPVGCEMAEWEALAGGGLHALDGTGPSCARQPVQGSSKCETEAGDATGMDSEGSTRPEVP